MSGARMGKAVIFAGDAKGNLMMTASAARKARFYAPPGSVARFRRNLWWRLAEARFCISLRARFSGLEYQASKYRLLYARFFGRVLTTKSGSSESSLMVYSMVAGAPIIVSALPPSPMFRR